MYEVATVVNPTVVYSTNAHLPKQWKMAHYIFRHRNHCREALKPRHTSLYIMKPYGGRDLSAPKRIFNYRLSRARRTIENTFGIMSARFRVLRSPINMDAEKTRKATKATCVLHNFLLARSTKSYAPKGYADSFEKDGTLVGGYWRNEPAPSTLQPLQPAEGRDRLLTANNIRDEFLNCFMGEAGEVP